MIIVLEGVMGSGKTYEAVAYHILPALKSGRKVVTNIPLNREIFAAWYGLHMLDLILVCEDYIDEETGDYKVSFDSHKDFMDEWRDPLTGQSPLYVVDEAHIPFTTSRENRMHQLFIHASLSRRLGHDWVLITQDINNIFKPIARLVQSVHYMRKRVAVGSYKSYYHFVYEGLTKGKKYITKNVRYYDPDIFKLYKSHIGAEVDEAQLKVSQFRIWKAFLPSLIIFIILGLIIYAVVLYFSPDEELGLGALSGSPILSASNNDSAVDVQKPSSDVVFSKSEYLSEYDKKNTPVAVPVASNNSKKQVEKGLYDKEFVKMNDGLLSNEVINIAQVEQTIYERVPVSDFKKYRKAPLQNFKLQILGELFNPKTKQIDFIYAVWSDSGTMSQYNLKELVRMNYNIMPISDCMHLMDHPNISEPFYVTCHQPTFEKSKNVNSEVANSADAIKDKMVNSLKLN